jgi:ribosome-binding ATPase
LLRAGIVGLPNVGKSTLFNALISARCAPAANYPFCTIEPNVGVVSIPDERLQILKELVKTTVVIPTAIEFGDIAGLVKGASKGEGLGNQFLGHIREADAIIHVVRCFVDENIVHVSGKIDPIADIEIINTELALADLYTVEKRKDRVMKNAKSKEKSALIENEAMDKLIATLSDVKPVRLEDFTEEEKPFVKNLHLLSAKPVIYCTNVSEDDVAAGGNEYTKAVFDYAEKQGSEAMIISAQIESELIDLPPDEAKEYLNGIGVESSGVEKMIESVYKLLGLLTFFTAGDKEVRAWTVKKGAKAPQAAGEIHSDMEKGFIRAEITAYDDFVSAGTYAVARDRGVTRLEGKEYVVQDGDIVHFRFAV